MSASVQLLDAERPGRRACPGKVAEEDYEYVRRGAANIFVSFRIRTVLIHIQSVKHGHRKDTFGLARSPKGDQPPLS